MTDKETLRTSAIAESNGLGDKPRFGLFSQPISTAIGDDGQYKTKLHPRNEAGKPVTQQRNFQTSPTRSGQLKTSFFGPINSLATHSIKDEYIDPDRRLQQEENQTFSKNRKPDNFKPASGRKTLNYSAYNYEEEKPKQMDPKRNRQEDGKVKSKLRNFYTNPQTKVIASYFKPIKHIEDPYERAHMMQVERQKKQKNKEAEAPFKPNCYTAKLINPHKKVYEQDVELKPRQSKQIKSNILKHENKWRGTSPNKSGIYGYLQPFPKYIENPPKELKRISAVSAQKEIFKPMNIPRTTPSPSVTSHPTNLRKNFNHSFSHRF